MHIKSFLKKNQVLKYLLITFLLTWLFWCLLYASSKGIINPSIHSNYLMRFILLGGCMPSVLAIIYAGLTNETGEFKKLLRKITIWKINPLWYVFSIFFPAAIYYAPAIISNIFGNYYTLHLRFHPYYLLLLFGGQLLGGPLNEEFGWRGFVLPRLQRRFNPLISSIILGIIHGLWHLPLFFIPGVGQYKNSFIQFLIICICVSIYYTWMYNRTKGSLITVCLFHAGYNFQSVFFIMTTVHPTILYLIISNFIAIAPLILIGWHMIHFKDKKIVD